MSKNQKPTLAFRLALSAGFLILINAILLWVVTTRFPWVMPTIPGTSNDTVPFGTLIIIEIMSAVFVVLGSSMLYIKPANKNVWGIIILLSSIPSIIMGGGLIIGFILGITSGIKAIKWRPQPVL